MTKIEVLKDIGYRLFVTIMVAGIMMGAIFTFVHYSIYGVIFFVIGIVCGVIYVLDMKRLNDKYNKSF